jgi:hypothetical protein
MMVCHQLDSRGWTLSWNDRGIRILHDHHHVTLGGPNAFVSYIEGTDSVDKAVSLLQHGCLEPLGLAVGDVAADVERGAYQEPLDTQLRTA